jgi:hypothetical protein
MRVIRGILDLLLQGICCFLSFATTAQSAYTSFKDTLGLPNVSLISSGYETFATVWRPTGDSLPLYNPDYLSYLTANGEDTLGLSAAKTEDIRIEDSLVEHVDYFQNIFFDFDNGIVTYIAEDKHVVDTIIQLYPDPLHPNSNKYVVWCNNDGRYTICNVDFKQKVVSYDWYFEEIDNSGTFKFINTQFIEY